VLNQSHHFLHPDFVVARADKSKARKPQANDGLGKTFSGFWRIKERIFDYKGKYRKANAL